MYERHGESLSMASQLHIRGRLNEINAQFSDQQQQHRILT